MEQQSIIAGQKVIIMPAISMLIKPASSLCNLRCKYCFYHDEASKRLTRSYGIMNTETLENIVRRVFDAATGEVTFAFQGGEPTLAGIDYYRKLFGLCDKYNLKKIKVSYAIQTNGTLIADDERWAELFAEHDFLVGISVDGIRDLHDMNRVDANGDGTYKKILQAVSILRRHNVRFNILTVINSVTARNISKIYKYYKSQNWRYMQFIECLDPIDEVPFGNENSLTPERYLQYLKTLFDLWYHDMMAGDYISIRQFDNYLNVFAGYQPESCGMLGMCTIQYVTEADGSVFPCDFYVLDDYKIGNINDTGFKELFESGTAQNFIKESCTHSEKCKKCKWYRVCRTGCKRYKNMGEYIYCEAIYEFFEYSSEKFFRLIKKIQQE